MTYRLEIWYDGQEPQVHSGLTESQAVQAAGAFIRDMLRETSAIVKLVVEREP
jgi:hypothetical protein